MSASSGTRRPALLLRALLVAGAVAGSTLGPSVAVASADEPAGTTVVGRLVQAFAEEGPGGHSDAETASPLSWVETDDGAVRVPTEDLPGVPAGATVEVTLGGDVRDEGTVEHGLEPAQQVLSTGSVTPAETAAAVRGAVSNAVTVVLVAPAGTEPDADVTAPGRRRAGRRRRRRVLVRADRRCRPLRRRGDARVDQHGRRLRRPHRALGRGRRRRRLRARPRPAPAAVPEQPDRPAARLLLRPRRGRQRPGLGRAALRPRAPAVGDRPRAGPQPRAEPLLGPAVRRRGRDRQLPHRRLPRPLRRHGRLLAAAGVAERPAGGPARRAAGRLGPAPRRPGRGRRRRPDADGRPHGHPGAAPRRRRGHRLLAGVPDGDRPGRLARPRRRQPVPAGDRRPAAPRGGVPRLLGAARRVPVVRRPAGTPTCRPRCPWACRWSSPVATSPSPSARWPTAAPRSPWCPACRPRRPSLPRPGTPAPAGSWPARSAGRAGGVAAPAADAPAADTVAVTLPAAAPAELPLTPAPAEVQPAAASLDPASGSAPTGTLLVALAGAGLAGATLLVVRRARRLRTR